MLVDAPMLIVRAWATCGRSRVGTKSYPVQCELSAFLTSQTADFQECATRAFHMYIERNCYISVYVLFSRMKRIHQDSQNVKNKI